MPLLNFVPTALPAAGGLEAPQTQSRTAQMLAQLLAKQGMDASPIQSPWQGANRMAQAALAGLMMRQDRKREQEASKLLMNLPGLSGAGASTPVAPSAMPGAAGATTVPGAPSPKALASALGGSRKEFVERVLPYAMTASAQTGVDPRIIIGQAALESGYGRKAPGNNFFGIKSHGQPGGQTFTTTEFVNGAPVKQRDSFRQYAGLPESVQGYADFINRNPRYRGLKGAKGLDAQLLELQRSGYATDPNYSAKVGAIARGIPLGEMPRPPAPIPPVPPSGQVPQQVSAQAQSPASGPGPDMAEIMRSQGTSSPIPYPVMGQGGGPRPMPQAMPGAVPPVPPVAAPGMAPQRPDVWAGARPPTAQDLTGGVPGQPLPAPNALNPMLGQSVQAALANPPRGPAQAPQQMMPGPQPGMPQAVPPVPPQGMAPQPPQAVSSQAATPQRTQMQIPPEVAGQIRALLANPNTRALGMQLYQQYAKPVEQFVPVRDEQGNIIGQRSTQSGKVETYPTRDKPQFTEIGRDPTTGEAIRGWVDPVTRQVTPVRPNLGPTPSSSIPPPPPGVDPKIWREQFSKNAAADALPPKFDDVKAIRKEVMDLPSYKNHAQAFPIYRSMLETAGRNSRASDLNLVYGLGKIMDPTSVVREGEMVMVKDTASLPDWFVGAANRLNGGAALQPETRRAIMQEAFSRMKSYEDAYEYDTEHYRGIAGRSRMNVDDVIPPLRRAKPWEPPKQQQGGQAQSPFDQPPAPPPTDPMVQADPMFGVGQPPPMMPAPTQSPIPRDMIEQEMRRRGMLP